ncbi:MAG TPA: hypothetical protein VG164_06685 [Trebonia sp.]|nr:hypothetical protein [Trebonia sp.]
MTNARLPGWTPDVVAAALAAGVLVGISVHAHIPGGRPLDALAYVLLTAAGLAMGPCLAGRWPRPPS